MTTLKETRQTEEGNSYEVYTPVRLASDKAFGSWFAEYLREFLYRQGCRVDHIPDETLLLQTRNTFQSVRARDGITVASPVESRDTNHRVPKEEPA